MISTKPIDWRIQFSPGMPKHPTTNSNGWEFNFPASHYPDDDLQSINYVNTNKFSKTLLGQLLTMIFQVEMSNDVKFEYGFGLHNPGLRPANVRFYLQQGIRLSNFANTRWWSNPVSCDLVLATTDIELKVNLNPSEWSNIYGNIGDENENTIKGFQIAVAKMGAIGMTFGGGSYFGHGVWISQGSAKFILKEFKCQ